MCGLVLVGAYPLTRNYRLPLPPQTIILCKGILSHNPAHVKSEKMQVMGCASLRPPLLAGGHVPFPLGTPSFPWKCPIAFPRKKRYNVDKTTKKAGRKGAGTPARPYAGDLYSPTQQI